MATDKNMESWNRYRQQYIGFANQATGETARQSQLTSGGYGNPYKGNSASQAQDNYLSKLYNQFSGIYGTTDRPQGEGALNTDGLWNNYADQYVRGGRQAMRDTLGQYEAQTGGYANSLATGAAAQAYYKYLDELNGNWTKGKMPSGGRGPAGGSMPKALLEAQEKQLGTLITDYNGNVMYGDDKTITVYDKQGNPYEKVIKQPKWNAGR